MLRDIYLSPFPLAFFVISQYTDIGPEPLYIRGEFVGTIPLCGFIMKQKDVLLYDS